MIFSETSIKGNFVIELEKFEDERGFFSTSWSKEEFEKHGLGINLLECNISFNKKKGTIRGLHYQIKPHEGAKLIRCTRGSIYDVIIDLRTSSKTFMNWLKVEISAENFKMHYIPSGCAHGFQTLENNTEVFYQMFQKYMPSHTKGIRWDDESFRISWPLKPTVISKKDSSWQSFSQN